MGKTTTARILAKALNCVKGPTAEPDNTCDSCREISAGTSLDVLEIDAASNRGIDQIRELREMVRYAPASSRYKVVILDEAHQLTDEASNALLKTLEEPPERVVFILATTRSEDLVDTIKSRAQLFNFRSLTFKEIAGEIERVAKSENLKIDPGAVAVLARAAEGSLRDGLSLLEQAIATPATKSPTRKSANFSASSPKASLTNSLKQSRLNPPSALSASSIASSPTGKTSSTSAAKRFAISGISSSLASAAPIPISSPRLPTNAPASPSKPLASQKKISRDFSRSFSPPTTTCAASPTRACISNSASSNL